MAESRKVTDINWCDLLFKNTDDTNNMRHISCNGAEDKNIVASNGSNCIWIEFEADQRGASTG